jgi:hypothetical protein
MNSLSSGREVLSTQMKKLSNFTDDRRNLWISSISIDPVKKMKIEGYTLNRLAAKSLRDSYNGSLLMSMLYEPLRLKSYKFSIDAGNMPGGKQNE